MNLAWLLSKPMPLTAYVSSCEFIVICQEGRNIWRCDYFILPLVPVLILNLPFVARHQKMATLLTLRHLITSVCSFTLWLLQPLTPGKEECSIVS